MSEIAVYNPEPRVGNLRRSDVEFIGELARTVVGTDFVKRDIRNSVPAIIACALYGDALGIHPMIAWQGVDTIDGRTSLSAGLITARILQAGHDVWHEEHRDEHGEIVAITAHGKRANNGRESAWTFGIKDAERAKLTGKQNYQRYPASMMWARALTQLARMLFAEVFSGPVYSPEELGADDVRQNGEVPAGLPSAAVLGEGPQADTGSVNEPTSVSEAMAHEPPSSPNDSGEGNGRDACDDHPVESSPDLASEPRISEDPPEEGVGPGNSPPPSSGGPTSKQEAAKRWIITGDTPEAGAVIRAIGSEERAERIRAQWDAIPDAVTLKGKIVEQTDIALLLFLADHEARHKARKGVLHYLHKQLVSLGWRSQPDESAGEPIGVAGRSGQYEPDQGERPDGPGESSSPAEPLPEALHAADVVLRFRVVARLSSAYDWGYTDERGNDVTFSGNPKMWTEDAILYGLGQTAIPNRLFVDLTDVPADDLEHAWQFVPADVRDYIERLPLAEVERLAA